MDDFQELYKERGFDTREGYLESLSEDYGVPLHVVNLISSEIGQEEDFDYLLVALDEISGEYEDYEPVG
jgi:hypothetical protein